jgi:hypothetical protein
MCGIAGLYRGPWPDEMLGPLLERMSSTLVHRGPDDYHKVLAPAMRAGLAVHRLSLVDLAGGRQPLENEDGTLVLACNGEIYNHRELRSELLAKGHRFRTESDCEVIVHLYEEIGLDCLKRLNGMFALALLDVRAHRLVLARDPAGMKPLYLAERAGGIAFASEPRALPETGIVSPAPDWDGIDTYLAFGYAPAPRSCFAGLERLPPGSYLVAEDGRLRRGSFWRCRYPPAQETRDPANDLECRLRAAVRRHPAQARAGHAHPRRRAATSRVGALGAARRRSPIVALRRKETRGVAGVRPVGPPRGNAARLGPSEFAGVVGVLHEAVRKPGGRLVHAPPLASQPSPLDGDMMQPGQLPLRVNPRPCSQFAQDFTLRLGPEGPRHPQSSSPFRCEPHRLDPPVGVRSALEHAVALQEGKAARQGRLVNGELLLQLLEARLT